jgi:hypothetical protein
VLLGLLFVFVGVVAGVLPILLTASPAALRRAELIGSAHG